jgi:cobalamin biosynthesis Mg chelatase CobN
MGKQQEFVNGAQWILINIERLLNEYESAEDIEREHEIIDAIRSQVEQLKAMSRAALDEQTAQNTNPNQ